MRFPFVLFWVAAFAFCGAAEPQKVFRAGAATSNITPWLGVSINGGFRDHIATNVHDEVGRVFCRQQQRPATTEFPFAHEIHVGRKQGHILR